jgi:urease accessory protein UreE
MQTIQLVLTDHAFAKRLKQLLAENGNWPVAIKEVPSFHKGGVVVLDDTVLAGLAAPPDYPDRVVLVTRNVPELLAHAWELGIRSVVYDTDSPSTVILAVMAAYLRLPRTPEMPQRRVLSPNAPTSLLTIDPAAGPSRR